MNVTVKGGRRPADQVGATRQDVWLALKQSPEKFTTGEIAQKTGLTTSPILRYLKALTAAGYLEFTAGRPGVAGSWRLIKDIGHHAPRVRSDGSPVTQGEVTGQLWRAMTMLKDFDYVELIQHASIPIPEETSKDYCKRLLAAGYLRVLVKADPHVPRIARYRLIRASGPKAPQVQRVRQVFDPNTGTAYPAAGDAP